VPGTANKASCKKCRADVQIIIELHGGNTMPGRQRLYFMLPDVASARGLRDDLLLAQVGIGHIHFWARDSRLPLDLPDAGITHKTDLVHGAEIGLAVGGILGFIGGVWLAIFPPEWAELHMLKVLLMTMGGALAGGWMGGIAAAAFPNSRLRRLQQSISDGWILLLADVPGPQVSEIEALLKRRQAEVHFAGVDLRMAVLR
jgi:hypothetical protein